MGDPFLGGDIRYHCPVFGFLKFVKRKTRCFKRIIWDYNHGDYDLLRSIFNDINWHEIENNDLDIYTKQFTETILNNVEESIPHKTVIIRKQDPPWFRNDIRRMIRKRRRAYVKAKRVNSESVWTKYRNLRNKTTEAIRKAKFEHVNKIASKLQNDK